MNPSAGPTLRDVHLPDDPSWWPPASGWWLLTAVALIALYFLLRTSLKWWRRRRRRKQILADIERIARQYASDADRTRLAASLSQFLRRLILLVEPQAVALIGEAWLAHLDTYTGGNDFIHGPGRALLDAPYRMTAQFDGAALLALAQRWTQRALTKGPGHV